jgi:ribosomal protein S18 acetylase RimI-like enzyme
MTVSLADLQSYLRQVAAQQYETIALPGFTLYFHPSDDLVYFNYAIPDPSLAGPGKAGDLHASLARMRAECAARRRRPRFEFIAECAPGLDAALGAAGFVEEARQSLMVCTPDRWAAAPPVQGLCIHELDAAAPLDELRAFLDVRQRGFDLEALGSAGEAEARQFARTLGQGRVFVARTEQGLPVAAGMYSAPLAAGPGRTRIAELAGLATLAPFRRRGIATALAAHAVRSAFERGVEGVCLVAADARAGRVYGRIGFEACATMLAYIEV